MINILKKEELKKYNKIYIKGSNEFQLQILVGKQKNTTRLFLDYFENEYLVRCKSYTISASFQSKILEWRVVLNINNEEGKDYEFNINKFLDLDPNIQEILIKNNQGKVEYE